jgi:hypothetical protein
VEDLRTYLLRSPDAEDVAEVEARIAFLLSNADHGRYNEASA